MNKEIILSVGIPSYNISDYVIKCLESFSEVSQDFYCKFELIFVNDGSKDDTVQVIEEFLSKSYLNARIITKENGGHGSAVNRGINEAIGKYYLSLDGDDWINPKDFEKLLINLSNEEAEVVFTNFTEQHVYNNTVINHRYNELYPTNQLTSFLELTTIMPMHSVIYKLELLRKNNIRLTEGIYYVDNEYILYPFIFAKNFVYYNLDIYQYLIGRAGQSMNTANLVKNNEHFIKLLASIFLFINKNKKQNNIFFRIVAREISDRYIQTSYLYSPHSISELLAVYRKFGLVPAHYVSKVSKIILLNFKTHFIFDFICRSYLKCKIKNRLKI